MNEFDQHDRLVLEQVESGERGFGWLVAERLRELVGVVSAGERYSSLDDPELVVFPTSQSQQNYRYNGRFASVAIVNPNIFPIYVALGGDAAPGKELITVDPLGWLVLPIVGSQLVLNSNGNLGSVYVLPFRLAQPFAKGAVPPIREPSAPGGIPQGAAIAATPVLGGAGGWASLWAAGEINDGDIGSNSASVVSALWTGAGFDKPRTPSRFVSVKAVAVVAGMPVAVWTPAAGKKFRLMGYSLSLSVAGAILFEDQSGAVNEFWRTPLLAAGVGLNSPDLGNGHLAAAANDVLYLDVTASGSVSGFVYGTEE